MSAGGDPPRPRLRPRSPRLPSLPGAPRLPAPLAAGEGAGEVGCVGEARRPPLRLAARQAPHSFRISAPRLAPRRAPLGGLSLHVVPPGPGMAILEEHFREPQRSSRKTLRPSRPSWKLFALRWLPPMRCCSVRRPRPPTLWVCCPAAPSTMWTRARLRGSGSREFAALQLKKLCGASYLETRVGMLPLSERMLSASFSRCRRDPQTLRSPCPPTSGSSSAWARHGRWVTWCSAWLRSRI